MRNIDQLHEFGVDYFFRKNWELYTEDDNFFFKQRTVENEISR